MNATPDDGRPTGAGPTGGQPRRRRSARRDQGPPVAAPLAEEQSARVEPGKAKALQAEARKAEAPKSPAADSAINNDKSSGNPSAEPTRMGSADTADGQRGRKRNKPRHRVEARGSDRNGSDRSGEDGGSTGSPSVDTPSGGTPNAGNPNAGNPNTDNPAADNRGRHQAPVSTLNPSDTPGRSPQPEKTADHGQPKRRSRVRDRSHQEAEPVETAAGGSKDRGATPEQPKRDRAGQDRSRQEHVRQEHARQEPQRSSQPDTVIERPDSARQEPPRPEPAKQEPARYEPPARTNRDRRAEIAERALRNLVSTRSTQVSWASSIRARDYAAPTAEDLAEAAEELVIVQRHYTPAEPLQGKGRARPEQPPGRFTNKRGN